MGWQHITLQSLPVYLDDRKFDIGGGSSTRAHIGGVDILKHIIDMQAAVSTQASMIEESQAAILINHARQDGGT